jgi:hypothetical protein
MFDKKWWKLLTFKKQRDWQACRRKRSQEQLLRRRATAHSDSPSPLGNNPSLVLCSVSSGIKCFLMTSNAPDVSTIFQSSLLLPAATN